MSTRQVLYTPFMNQVASVVVTGRPGPDEDLELVPTSRRSLARAVDDWHALRGRAEQVVAEANSMLPASLSRVELTDEVAQLTFIVRHASLWARVSLVRSGTEGWVELERSWSGTDGVEPGQPAVLEDLVLKLIAR